MAQHFSCSSLPCVLVRQPLRAHPPAFCPHPQEHLRGEALKTNELLRHLWGTLPLVSAARAEKAAKLARHLGEQRALLRSHMEAHPGKRWPEARQSLMLHVVLPGGAVGAAVRCRAIWRATQGGIMLLLVLVRSLLRFLLPAFRFGFDHSA